MDRNDRPDLLNQALGDGRSTAATPHGAAQLAAQSRTYSKVGFSGAMFRRRAGGPLAFLFDFLFGKDPAIFDAQGRIRHQFSEQKWKAWDDRLRASKDYDWRKHSGQEVAEGQTQPSKK